MPQFTVSQFKKAPTALVLMGLLCTTSVASANSELQERLNEAKMESNKGNLNTAKGMLLDLLNSKPNSLRTKAELAMVYYRLGQWQESQALLTPLLKVNNLPPNVRRNLNRLNQSVIKKLGTDDKPIAALSFEVER